MPNPRYAYAAARGADGKLDAMGGVAASDSNLTTGVDPYDIAGDSWSASISLQVARAYANAVTAPDGQTYVISGSTAANEYTNDVMVRRPVENRWLASPTLIGKRTGA